MYQALYRKYRPANFNEVYGQEVIVKILKNAIINHKITHAYLFSGPRGTGKTSIAKILSKTLNCFQLNGVEPCNNCDSCIQTNRKSNVDIIEIDAASNNGVDEIRELKSKVNLVPSIGKYKVYIIDEVHMLTIGAFNALLKTLEEPPEHAIFILATTEPHKIPLTILSRCQKFDFKKISEDKIVENLKNISQKEDIQITEEALREIARISDGGMRDSIGLLDEAIAYAENNITVEDIHSINGTLTSTDLKCFIEQILLNNVTEILNLIDQYDQNGKNLTKLVEELIEYLKNYLIYKTVPNYFEDKSFLADQDSLFQKISNQTLYNYIKEFNASLVEMKMTNNSKLVLQLTVIKLLNMENMEKMEKDYQPLKNHNPQQKKIVEESKKISNLEEKKDILDNEKEIKSVNNDVPFSNKIEKLKEIRINNTLSEFDKKELLAVKEKILNIHTFIVNEKYRDATTIVLDGQIRAASKKYLIFVYESDMTADLFNQNITIIEEMLKEALQSEYRVIAVDLKKWEIIKQEFNSKTKKYPFIPEDKESAIFMEPKDELTNLFGNIVEYK